MSQEKQWVEQPKTGGGDGNYNPEWKPTQVSETIEGTLINRQQNVGVYNKAVYDIEVPGVATYSVWGTKVLEGLLNPVQLGSYVKIEYLGKKKGKGNEYHDYNVFIASNMAPAPPTDIAATDPALQAAAPVAAPVTTPAPVVAPVVEQPVAAVTPAPVVAAPPAPITAEAQAQAGESLPVAADPNDDLPF